MSELLKPIEAARLAGVSYPTLKQWIYQGKIRSTKTAGGHHRIARSEVERVTGGPRKKSERTTARFFNTSAFTVAPQFTLGNSSRNPVRGPAYRNMDLAVIKRFRFGEERNVELRFEAF